MATYNKTSPYSTTRIDKANKSLDVLNFRDIPHIDEDITYSIAPEYANRPDLLAYDMYGNPNLWWVFCQRNMDTMEDPIYDFKSGATIYVPKGGPLKNLLGV